MDTSKELSASGELDLNENDDIIENYGKEDNRIFKQTIYTKKSDCLIHISFIILPTL